MSGGPIALIAVGVPALVALVYVVVTYNRFVTLRAHVRDAWAGIQVELKRRYELIPNLVEVAKGYAAHERETLERVVELRNRAMSNEGSPMSQGGDEAALNAGLRGLFAVAEAYPELRADGLFRELQAELVDTEDRIAATRRFYNGNVRELNELVGQFPSNLVGRMAGVTRADFFAIEEGDERTAPRVEV